MSAKGCRFVKNDIYTLLIQIFYVVVGSLCLKLKDNHNCNTLGENMIEIGCIRHNQILDIMFKQERQEEISFNKVRTNENHPP